MIFNIVILHGEIVSMDASHWVRVFKIPYRKRGLWLIQEENVQCETVKNGLHRPGEVTSIPTDTHVTVHVVTPYFEEPTTEEQQDQVDAIFDQCELHADAYLTRTFPDLMIARK
jgi:hypothetical protein